MSSNFHSDTMYPSHQTAQTIQRKTCHTDRKALSILGVVESLLYFVARRCASLRRSLSHLLSPDVTIVWTSVVPYTPCNSKFFFWAPFVEQMIEDIQLREVSLASFAPPFLPSWFSTTFQTSFRSYELIMIIMLSLYSTHLLCLSCVLFSSYVGNFSRPANTIAI